jgi:membrane-bound lytic murein transglycosylase A
VRIHSVVLILTVLVLSGFLGGCKPKEEAVDYARPLPPGMHALRRLTDPEMMPDFAAGYTRDPQQLLAAIDNSLLYLGHPSSRTYYPVQGITHEQVVRSLQAFRALVLTSRSADELRESILMSFDVYQSIGCDDRGTVFFTGYYQPVLVGSMERTAEYKYPLYKLPPDLVKDAEGLCAGRRLADGRIVPSPKRRELATSGELAGLELVYLKDKFDAYICHVQGSALIHLADGRWFEVGYAGKNAGTYASVG